MSEVDRNKFPIDMDKLDDRYVSTSFNANKMQGNCFAQAKLENEGVVLDVICGVGDSEEGV